MSMNTISNTTEEEQGHDILAQKRWWTVEMKGGNRLKKKIISVGLIFTSQNIFIEFVPLLLARCSFVL